MDIFVPQAIPFVSVIDTEEGGKDYIFNPLAKIILLALHGPLWIVSVVGLARRGKSTLLNMLLQKLGIMYDTDNLFQTLLGTQVCTYGIWMYGTPIPHPQGGHWIIIDTEGTDRNDDQVTQILSAISTFISSHLIFNVSQDFGNSSLGSLELIHMLLSVAVGEEASALFPDLTIIYRNVTRKWIASLNPSDPDRFLDENILAPLPNAPDKLAPIKESIRKVFTKRHLLLVCQPTEDELDEFPLLPPSASTTSFATTMHAALDSIISRTEPKRLGHAIITSEYLVKSIEAAIPALMSGNFPSDPARNIHQQIAESFVEEAFKKYVELMQPDDIIGTLTRDNAKVLHENAAGIALQYFIDHCELHDILEEFRDPTMIKERMESSLQFLLLKLENCEAVASVAVAMQEKEHAELAAKMAMKGAEEARIAAQYAAQRTQELQQQLVRVEQIKAEEIRALTNLHEANKRAAEASTKALRDELAQNTALQTAQLAAIQEQLQAAQQEAQRAREEATQAQNWASERDWSDSDSGGWCVLQ